MVVAHRRRKAFVYCCALIALLVYALPRLPKLQHGLGGTFSLIWILFACMTLAANLYFLVGADKERSRMLSAKVSGVVKPISDEASEETGIRRKAL